MMADSKYADWSEERKARRRKTLKAWYAANIERERKRSRERNARLLAADPAKRKRANESAAKWRVANPESIKKSTAAWRAANPEKVATCELRRALKKYGLSIEAYNALLIAQDGRCAICGTTKPGGKGRWHVDHCSKTNVVRRLLCGLCNPGLGFFKHDIALLQRAIDYLKSFS